MASWQTIGNLAHSVNISMVIAYALSTIVYGEQLLEKGIIDSRWFEEGFCKAEQASSDQMHFDAGLAMMVTFIPVTFLIYRHSKKGKTAQEKDGLKDMDNLYTNIKYGMVGVVCHAMGHFLIFEAIRAGVYPDGNVRGIDDLRQSTMLSVARKILPGFVLFFTPLMKSYMRNTSMPLVVLAAFVSQYGSLHSPMKYGFSFGLSSFFIGFSLDQLLALPSKEKGFAFAIYPLVTVIPSILFAWFECTSCSSSWILMKYGHSAFDSWLGVSYNMYAVITHLYLNNTSQIRVKKID